MNRNEGMLKNLDQQTSKSQTLERTLEKQRAQEVKNFFREVKKGMVAWEVGDDGFETGSAKESALNNLEYYGTQIGDLINGEKIKPNERPDYLEAMSILTGRFGQSQEHQLTGYDSFSEELQEEIRQNDQAAEKLFIAAAKKMFPDISPPHSHLEAISTLRVLSTREYVWPAYKSAFEVLAKHSNDIPKLIQIIDSEISNSGQALGHDMEYALLAGQEASSELKAKLYEGEQYIYQLRLIRDCLQGQEYGRTDVSPQERSKIDEIRQGFKGESAKASEAEPKYTRQELRAVLGKVKTVGQAREVVTENVKEQFLAALLNEVDSRVATAQRLKSEGRFKSNQVLESRSFANITGMGPVAVEMQKIIAAQEGIILSIDEIQNMSMAEVLNKYFSYDISKDNARAQLLREHTNLLG